MTELKALHTDDVIGDDLTVVASLFVKRECDTNCDPGNCEVQHGLRFGCGE